MNKKKSKGYLLPIRKEYCDMIFNDQRKFFEYRSKFDPSFEGRIFVYESGKDGCHKVIGLFETHTIERLEFDKVVSEKFDALLDSLPEQIVNDALGNNGFYAIPILHPARFNVPFSLENFSKVYGLEKVWTFPPQSRARIEWSAYGSAIVKPVTTSLEGVLPPFKDI